MEGFLLGDMKRVFVIIVMEWRGRAMVQEAEAISAEVRSLLVTQEGSGSFPCGSWPHHETGKVESK